MFNKSFKARVDGFSAAIRRQKGNNEDQQVICAQLLFELTDELANEIGGPAPRILGLMTTDDESASIGAVSIALNSRAVNVRFRVANKYHVISETIALRLRVVPPTAQNVSPMLQVRVSFLAGPNDLAMLWNEMGKHVGVRMDRQQLLLPGMDQVPQAEGEVEPDFPEIGEVTQ